MNNMTNFELLINLNEIEREKEWKPKFQQKKIGENFGVGILNYYLVIRGKLVVLVVSK